MFKPLTTTSGYLGNLVVQGELGSLNHEASDLTHLYLHGSWGATGLCRGSPSETLIWGLLSLEDKNSYGLL